MSRQKRDPKLTLLLGNPGKGQVNVNTPKPRPVMPRCPAFIGRPGKKLWKTLGPKLVMYGVMSELDGTAFAALCQCYSMLVEAQQELKRLGNPMTVTSSTGQETVHPLIRISDNAAKSLVKYCGQFGLSPASRSNVFVNFALADQDKDPLNLGPGK